MFRLFVRRSEYKVSTNLIVRNILLSNRAVDYLQYSTVNLVEDRQTHDPHKIIKFLFYFGH